MMLLTAMLLPGCSATDFSKFKVKDINQYSALGYRTGNIGKSSTKRRINSIKYQNLWHDINSYYSDSPFYLSAMLDDNITNIEFDNGDNSGSYPICSYMNFPGFVGFVGGNFRADLINNEYVLYDYFKENHLTYLKDHSTYLLSKGTVKIYDITNMLAYDDTNGDWRDIYMFGGTKIHYLYLSTFKFPDQENKFFMTLSENTGSLDIQSNDMLTYYLNEYSDNILIDKYGNLIIMASNHEQAITKIFTWEQKILDVQDHVWLDNVLNQFMYHSESDDSYYFLDDNNEFIKHDYQVTAELRPGTGCPTPADGLIYSSPTKQIYNIGNNDFTIVDITGDYSYSKRVESYDFYRDLKGYNIRNLAEDSGGYNYEVTKIDLVTNETTVLKMTFDGVDILEVKEITMDDEGYIIVKGYDTSYKKFEGYMDETSQYPNLNQKPRIIISTQSTSIVYIVE